MQKPPDLPPGWMPWLRGALPVPAAIPLCTRPYAYVNSFNYALHIL